MKYLSRINKKSFLLGLSIIMIGGVQSCSFDNHNIEIQQPNILWIVSEDNSAYGMYIRHAKNVYLYNIQFNLMQPDYRPAIWFEDAHDITLRSFKATLPEGNQKLIMERASDVKILD